jgi:hypothetical protein
LTNAAALALDEAKRLGLTLKRYGLGNAVQTLPPEVPEEGVHGRGVRPSRASDRLCGELNLTELLVQFCRSIQHLVVCHAHTVTRALADPPASF